MHKASVARYLVLVVTVVNTLLNLFGYQTIPESMTNDLVLIISAAYTLFMAWKNNYLSKKGIAQKEVLDKNGLK
jgi:SPP1 family holin